MEGVLERLRVLCSGLIPEGQTRSIESLSTPACLIDLERFISNCDSMIKLCEKHNVRLLTRRLASLSSSCFFQTQPTFLIAQSDAD